MSASARLSTGELPHDAPNSAPVAPQAAREAVQWLLDLRDKDDSPAVLADWQRWLTADPAHQQAWLRIESVNQQLRAASSPLAAAVARAGLQDPPKMGRRRAAQALAIALVGGSAAWMVERHAPWREMAADLRTGVGERRATTLADGSTVVLNTASAINVRFGAAERRLQLVAGEVLITTAHGAAASGRAFVVETRHGQAQALGTRFSVRQDEHATRVAVFDGAVQIRPSDANASSVLLRAGQQTRFNAAGARTASPADALTDTAWTHGSLVALSMRLDDFLEELGRYSDRPLSCDPAVAALRISGSYPTGNVDAALRSVAQALSLRVEVVDRLWRPQAMRLAPAGRA